MNAETPLHLHDAVAILKEISINHQSSRINTYVYYYALCCYD